MKRQHASYDLIAPHVRLLEFLSSHFSATRHGSPHIQKVYQRLINVTLDALARTRSHPLARECHFYVILLGLRILRASTDFDRTTLWRFKDRLLSAALAWFAFPPRYGTLCSLHHQYWLKCRWSYGGNQWQIKAELRIMSDIQVALDAVKSIGLQSSGSMKSLQPKQELLIHLLSSEHTRLTVWLFPLGVERRHPPIMYQYRTTSDVSTSLQSIVPMLTFQDPVISSGKNSLDGKSCACGTLGTTVQFVKCNFWTSLASLELSGKGTWWTRCIGDASGFISAHWRIVPTEGTTNVQPCFISKTDSFSIFFTGER